MADMRPIPTPLAYRWQRFVQNFLPIVIFLIAIILTLWLWDRQSQMGNAIGVAEAEYVDVPSGSAGILMPPGHGQWQEFQTVKQGEIIGEVRLAQTDTFAARVATIEKEKEKVEADLEAEKEKFLLEMQRQDEGLWFDISRQTWRVEEIRQNIYDIQTRIKTRRAQLQTARTTQRFNENALERGGAISKQEVAESQFRTKELEEALRGELTAQENAKKDFKREWNTLVAARKELASQGQTRDDDLGKVIRAITAPYYKQREVLESQANEVRVATNSYVIHAPVDGVVAAVYAVPGQSVQPGDPVIQIASANSDAIISYVRHRQRVRPELNMVVKLRTRHTGSRPVDSSVIEVGPIVQPVPTQHLFDHTRPEWGVPIKIALPDDLRNVLKPGEQVDIIFPSRNEQAPPPPASGNPEVEL